MNTKAFSSILKLLGYIYVIAGPFIPLVFHNLLSNYPLLTLALTPSWIALVGKILYDNNSTFYFWFTRTYMFFVNTEVEWSLNVILKNTNLAKNTINEIFEEILSIYPDSKVWHSEDNKKIIELISIGCNIRIEEKIVGDSLDNEDEQLVFSVSELVVPFRKSEKISEQIISVINNILLQHVSSKSQKYTLKIKFGKNNPYFGLFVRKLRVEDKNSVNFHVEFNENVGHKKEKIQVSNQYVTLVTQNLTNLQTLSKRYITLATIDMSNWGN